MSNDQLRYIENNNYIIDTGNAFENDFGMTGVDLDNEREPRGSSMLLPLPLQGDREPACAPFLPSTERYSAIA